MIDTSELLIIILPLVVLELGLLIAALRNWMKQPKDMQDRMPWLVIICLVTTIGPILYFLFANRVNEEEKWID